jgi:5-methylcytosine-specific restriction endonuclease McrA
MALIPDPIWSKSTDDWSELVARYCHFRRVKSWRGRERTLDGRMRQNRLQKVRAQRVGARLSARIKELREKGILPERVSMLSDASITRVAEYAVYAGANRANFDSGPAWLKDLWRAFVLNRDGYTCRYCHRSAWEAHAELGAVPRFENDHTRAKARLGGRRNDFSVKNIVLACRSCNMIKGQMTLHQFKRELASLARSITAHQAG